MKNTNCIKTFFRNSKNSLDEYGINSLLYSLGEYKELKTIKDFFDEANQIYGGYFMPENAVKKLEKFIKKDSWLFN